MWPLKKAVDALEEHLINLPPDTVDIEVDDAGRLLAFGTSPDKDGTGQTEYPRIEQFGMSNPRCVLPLVGDFCSRDIYLAPELLLMFPILRIGE